MYEALRYAGTCCFTIVLFFPSSAFADSCLPPKLAKRVTRAALPEGRIERYLQIAGKQNLDLGIFLWRYQPWSECEDPKQAVKGIENNTLDILACTWTEMRIDLQGWPPPNNAKQTDTLVKLQGEVAEVHRSFERSAALGPAPYKDELKRIRELIEDVELLLKLRISPPTK